MGFGWTFGIHPHAHKDVYLLHPGTQIIVNEASHFVQHEGFVQFRKRNQIYENNPYLDSLIKQRF